MASILVIDDYPEARSFLVRALQGCGYDVCEAANGRDGVKQYATGAFDLVITDIVMPEMDGMECITELRRQNPAAVILAISGGGSHLDKDSCLKLAQRLGAQAVLPKPFRLQALEETVSTLLETA